MSRAYKKYSTSDNLPIQVESAIRDGSGKNIENNYAKQDGSYATMNVGHAESSSSLDTNIGIDDQTPFNYQTAGGDSDITTGIQSLKKLVGASVVFNQLVQNGNFADTSNWVSGSQIASKTASNNVLTITTNASTDSTYVGQNKDFINGHKYLTLFEVKNNDNDTSPYGFFRVGTFGSTYYANNNIGTTFTKCYKLFEFAETSGNYALYVGARTSTAVALNYSLRNAMCIDLTQMFGSAVADYIYAKEQANAGDGVAIFKSMFPNDYYAYNTGTFIHSKSAKLKMVDYNQWDEQWELGTLDVSTGLPIENSETIRSKNFNECLPNTDYYGYIPTSYTSEYALAILFYDNEENFISAYYRIKNGVITSPSNARYFKICTMFYGTTYNNDICIFIYWDGSRIGYEPYQEHIYDLPNDELKGVLKVVDNKIIADGDEEYPDGTKKTRYVQITINAENITDYGQAGINNIYSALTNIVPPYAPLGPFTTTNIGKSSNYLRVDNNNLNYLQDKTIALYTTSLAVRIRDDSITTLEGFKALCPITLIYRVADDEVTETTSTAFAENIYVDDFGTMEFLDENDTCISGIQGNEIFYKANISGFAESLYVKVDGDPEEYVTQEELATTVANINNTINAMAIENTKKFNAVDNRLLVLENIVDTVYSISFNGNSTEGTRGGRAASLAGNTLDETIANFMAEPFFARIQKVDLPAFKSDGTPLYDTDGTTQLVNKMVFFPNAYLKYENNNGVTTFTISPSARDGYVPIWKNEDGTIPDGAYVGCYNNGKCTDDVSTTFDYVGSFTGKASVVNYNRTQYMSKSNFVDVDGTKVKLNATMPLNAYNYISILGMIVLGTRNFQSVYNGISSDVYKTPTDQNSTNKTFTVADMTLAIGDKVTLYYSSGYCWCTREITNVNGTTYTYDGDAVPSITYVGYRTGCVNGLTDNINGLFGEDTTLSSGRRPFKMFGVENIYGNLWEIVGNAAIHGSASPYTELYTHQYDDYDYTSPSSEISTMTGTGVNIPTSNGYCKTLGQAGSTFITTEVGGDSSTNYCDYFYQSATSNDRAVVFGGYFYDGARDGGFCFYCHYDWLVASWYYAVRSFLLKQ